MLKDTESGKTVTIDVEYTPPEVTREYLESILFRDLIGECETQIQGTANRLNNIAQRASNDPTNYFTGSMNENSLTDYSNSNRHQRDFFSMYNNWSVYGLLFDGFF